MYHYVSKYSALLMACCVLDRTATYRSSWKTRAWCHGRGEERGQGVAGGYDAKCFTTAFMPLGGLPLYPTQDWTKTYVLDAQRERDILKIWRIYIMLLWSNHSAEWL